MDELIERIAEFNGKDGTYKKFKEESIELLTELYFGNKERVIDELVDVFLVMEQVRILWNISHSELQERLRFKINRTIKRLNDGTLKKAK